MMFKRGQKQAMANYRSPTPKRKHSGYASPPRDGSEHGVPSSSVDSFQHTRTAFLSRPSNSGLDNAHDLKQVVEAAQNEEDDGPLVPPLPL